MSASLFSFIIIYLNIYFQRKHKKYRRPHKQVVESSVEVEKDETKPIEVLPPMAAGDDMIDNRVPLTGNRFFLNSIFKYQKYPNVIISKSGFF